MDTWKAKAESERASTVRSIARESRQRRWSQKKNDVIEYERAWDDAEVFTDYLYHCDEQLVGLRRLEIDWVQKVVFIGDIAKRAQRDARLLHIWLARGAGREIPVYIRHILWEQVKQWRATAVSFREHFIGAAEEVNSLTRLITELEAEKQEYCGKSGFLR